MRPRPGCRVLSIAPGRTLPQDRRLLLLLVLRLLLPQDRRLLLLLVLRLLLLEQLRLLLLVVMLCSARPLAAARVAVRTPLPRRVAAAGALQPRAAASHRWRAAAAARARRRRRPLLRGRSQAGRCRHECCRRRLRICTTPAGTAGVLGGSGCP